jgi:hypothetical protein
MILDDIPNTPLGSRIRARITVNEHGCWIANGSPNTTGYKQISIGGKRRVIHRVLYELLIGPIPSQHVLDHLCRVRACCNPLHVEPVTVYENTLRGKSPTAEYARRTHCDYGHPFTIANTYLRNDGGRRCKTCRKQLPHFNKEEKRALNRMKLRAA